MFNKSAQYYDVIYSFKNYDEESKRISELIKDVNPTALRILDVACGTAEHAKRLSMDFDVHGIDIEPEFIKIASSKIPSGVFKIADMRNFDLGIKFDIVLCLFSSIGYLTKQNEVIAALKCFKSHINEGGAIFIEPWFRPEQWVVNTPHMQTVDLPELKICRMNTSLKEGTISKIIFHYLIGKSGGVEHFTESHDLALYSLDEMASFFDQAELHIEYDPIGISGRGLYVARPR